MAAAPTTLNPSAWIKNLLTNARCFEQVCQSRFQEFDSNGNAVLEFSELIAMIASLVRTLGIEAPAESKIRAAFDIADKNHDGVLSMSEFTPFFRAFLKEAVPASERKEVDEVERLENERRAARDTLEAEAQKLAESHNGKLVLAEFDVVQTKTNEVENHTVVSASKEGALAFAEVATAERQKENPGAQGPFNLRYREVEVKGGRCNSAVDTEMAQRFLGMEYRKKVGVLGPGRLAFNNESGSVVALGPVRTQEV